MTNKKSQLHFINIDRYNFNDKTQKMHAYPDLSLCDWRYLVP